MPYIVGERGPELVCPDCLGMSDWQGQKCGLCLGTGKVEDSYHSQPGIGLLICLGAFAIIAYIAWRVFT